MQGRFTIFQLAMSRRCYNVANFLVESGCVNLLHNAGRQFLDLDLVEKEISELCPCKRGFKLERPGESAIVMILAKPVHLIEMIRTSDESSQNDAKIPSKPVHLVDMIRNPRSLLELLRVTVRKQLNRRIDRVQELDIPQKLRDYVTRKHVIDRCEPVGNACECGRIYGRSYAD